MDGIFECMVSRKTPGYAPFVKAALIALIVIGLAGIIITPWMIVAAIGFGVAAYIIIPKLSVEWEYTFIDGSLSVDCIYSRSARKAKQEFSFERVELIALAKSPDISRILDNPKSGYTVVDYSSQYPEHTVYGMIYTDGAQRLLVLLEPDERMLGAMRRYASRKVQLY